MGKPFQKAPRDFIRFTLVGVIGATGIGVLSFGLIQFYYWFHPSPAGYTNWFERSNKWNADEISAFLNVDLPIDTADLMIEGTLGVLGSRGKLPQLRFEFRASPQNAEGFLNAFCDGIFHAGYNPLEAVDLALPAEESLLIRVGGSIHYSQSPNVPLSIRGNRCMRFDERSGSLWVEEWALDTSNPAEYQVLYRLPYSANGNPAEFYPQARFVNPAGNHFRLYVTGISSTTESGVYSIDYPILCFQTVSPPFQYDFFYWNPDFMQPFNGATVAVFVDNIEQPPARVSEHGSLTPLHINTTSPLPRWSYCLETRGWQHGRHPVDLRIQPVSSEAMNISFLVDIPNGDS